MGEAANAGVSLLDPAAVTLAVALEARGVTSEAAAEVFLDLLCAGDSGKFSLFSSFSFPDSVSSPRNAHSIEASKSEIVGFSSGLQFFLQFSMTT